MNRRKDTAFTVELLGLFILLIVVITVISSVFVMSRAHSLQARQLNEAVIIAESTAEAASAAPDNETLNDLISKGLYNRVGGVKQNASSEDKGCVIVFAASIDGNEGAKGTERFLIKLTREYTDGMSAERADGGAYAADVIEVYESEGHDIDDIGMIDPSDLKDPLYTLRSGTYFGSDSNSTEGGGQ